MILDRNYLDIEKNDHGCPRRSGYQKVIEKRSRPMAEHCLILKLAIQKEASKDRDWSGLSITWPRTVMPTVFVMGQTLSLSLFDHHNDLDWILAYEHLHKN